MGTPLADYAILARIENAIHFVLRRDAEQGATVVPVQVLRERLAIAAHDLIAQLAVPYLGRTVAIPNLTRQRLRRGRNGDEIRDWIELDEGHLSVMALELQNGLCNRFRQTSLGELPELRVTKSGEPNHHGQVGRRANNLLIVEGVEIEIADITPANHRAKRDRTCVQPA